MGESKQHPASLEKERLYVANSLGKKTKPTGYMQEANANSSPFFSVIWRRREKKRNKIRKRVDLMGETAVGWMAGRGMMEHTPPA